MNRNVLDVVDFDNSTKFEKGNGVGVPVLGDYSFNDFDGDGRGEDKDKYRDATNSGSGISLEDILLSLIRKPGDGVGGTVNDLYIVSSDLNEYLVWDVERRLEEA